MREDYAMRRGPLVLRKGEGISPDSTAAAGSAGPNYRRAAPLTCWRAIALVAVLLLGLGEARSQQAIQVFTDNISYNVGAEVWLAVVGLGATSQLSNIVATLRYAGEDKPLHEMSLPGAAVRSETKPATRYVRLWRVPADARAGRYEIDLQARDSKSRQVLLNLPAAASFAVHRKLLQIDRVELDKSNYTTGDPVGCQVTLVNRSARPLAGLRIEFSDRYWPWIAQSSEHAGVEVKTLRQNLSLAPQMRTEAHNAECATAKAVKQPTMHQFAAVVWDQARKNVLDIAFSSLVVIHPAGINTPEPYPLQYLYPNLGAVNTSSYRHFYPAGSISPTIQFDREHTMFTAGDEAKINFSVQNSMGTAWRGTSISARLLDEGGKEVAKIPLATGVDLEPGAPPLKQRAAFTFPAQTSGVYRVEVTIESATGGLLAQASLELGVNPLPRSILIFCAHEDDEMAHAGIIRAAVENHVPLQLVYFTSGDSGSCDRYYQHSCSPAEALNFGAVRMDEARAALGHLGVSRENILFLGLPDGGSGEIWFRHREPSDPYLSVLLASDHAPYQGLVRPNLPYARQSVVEVAKELIRRFEPEVIYTGHPDERHVDHRVNNWFVVKALQELAREGAAPPDLTLLVDQVYGPGPQTHAPYRYEKQVLHASGEARARAQEATWFYQSQSGNRAEGSLRTFDQLPRTEIHWQVLDWKEHAGWNDKN
jgi:LmbE family N-acetylglucosaminyl deacetylase